MPGRADEEGNVDAAQSIVDWLDQQSVPRKEEARQGQRRVLRQTDLVSRSVQFQKGSSADKPLGHGRPKVDGKGTCRCCGD